MEDPNRIVEHRGFSYDELGRVVDPMGMVRNLGVTPTELTLDRLPPSADIMYSRPVARAMCGVIFSPESLLNMSNSPIYLS